MSAPDDRQRGSDVPIRVEVVIQRSNEVPIHRLYFIVIAGNFADADARPPVLYTVLVDVLVMQIEAGAGRDIDALHAPLRIDHAKGRAARCPRAERRAQGK